MFLVEVFECLTFNPNLTMENVDVEEELIFRNVFEDSFKENFKGNQEFLIYLSELSSYGIEKLNAEPRKLEEKRQQVMNETRSMAFDNYKTFIHTANCCRDIFQDFQVIEKSIESVLQTLPEVSKTSQQFLTQAKEINSSRKLNNQTLLKYAQILEVLEVSQLMDTCVRNEYYEESLELLEYVARLERKLMHIPLIQNIVEAVKQSKQQMMQQLLNQLKSSIQLPDCLKVVGILRRMNVLSESQLRIIFLQARDAWFQSVLQSLPNDDPYQHISKSIEVTRVHLFDISTQYRAIFSDDHSYTSRGTTDTSSLFHSWILLKVGEFLKTLESDLKAGITERLDSVLAQAMYFGLSFGRIGLDLRSLMEPFFIQALVPPFKQALNNANDRLEKTLKDYTLVGRQTGLHSSLDQLKDGGLQPPSCILNHPPLAIYLNQLLEALNIIRSCLLLSILSEVVQSLTTSLKGAVRVLIKFYRLDEGSMCEKEEEDFSEMCESMQKLVVHVHECVCAFFEEASLHAVIGNVFVEEQEMAEAGLRLKVIEICEPLEEFMPTKPVQFTVTSSLNNQSTTLTETTAVADSKELSTFQVKPTHADDVKTEEKLENDINNSETSKIEIVQGANEKEPKIEDVPSEVDDKSKDVSYGGGSEELNTVNKETENDLSLSDKVKSESDNDSTKDSYNLVHDNKDEKGKNAEGEEKEIDNNDTIGSDHPANPEIPVTTHIIPDS